MHKLHKHLAQCIGRPSLSNWKLTRRDVLKASGLVIAGGIDVVPSDPVGKEDSRPKLRFGMFTDSHYAEINPIGTRYYRESVAKLRECTAQMNKERVDFLIELGDLKDQGTPASESDTLSYLATIERTFRQFNGPRYHVLGNHDVDSISKEQFLAGIENTGIQQGSKYYSFDAGGLHLIVLDANYTADGTDYDHGKFAWTDTNIPREQLTWLKNDLASTAKPVIVFVHQPLDGIGNYYVNNAVDIRQLLQDSKKVLAVFQGHNHEGQYNRLNGIHYYTLKAMVEGSGERNNSFAIVNVHANLDIAVNGYHVVASKLMEKASLSK